MSKLESNLQLPTVILGGLVALIIKDVVQIVLSIPLQEWLTKLQSEYQVSAAQGEAVPWWVENLNSLFSLGLTVGVAIFAVAFYFFVVKENPIRFRKKTKTEAAVASVKKTVKKTVKKAKK